MAYPQQPRGQQQQQQPRKRIDASVRAVNTGTDAIGNRPATGLAGRGTTNEWLNQEKKAAAAASAASQRGARVKASKEDGTFPGIRTKFNTSQSQYMDEAGDITDRADGNRKGLDTAPAAPAAPVARPAAPAAANPSSQPSATIGSSASTLPRNMVMRSSANGTSGSAPMPQAKSPTIGSNDVQPKAKVKLFDGQSKEEFGKKYALKNNEPNQFTGGVMPKDAPSTPEAGSLEAKAGALQRASEISNSPETKKLMADIAATKAKRAVTPRTSPASGAVTPRTSPASGWSHDPRMDSIMKKAAAIAESEHANRPKPAPNDTLVPMEEELITRQIGSARNQAKPGYEKTGEAVVEALTPIASGVKNSAIWAGEKAADSATWVMGDADKAREADKLEKELAERKKKISTLDPKQKLASK